MGFSFNGAAYAGLAGDSLASALLANGVRTVSRSFKFHRPRGIFSCGIDEPNALVRLNGDADAVLYARAPTIELHDGLRASSQSGWPNVRVDAGRVLDFVAPLWAAGFYNKTFTWPSWHAYEWLVRRMAGSGQVPTKPDPDRYDTRNLHCDVLVIGGGAAGLSAAAAAARLGARVVLAEQSAALGGRSAWDGSSIESAPATKWLSSTCEGLSRLPCVRILTRTTAVGYYDHDVVTLLESLPESERVLGAPRERYWIVRAGRVVLASGAIEQPLVFCNNDRPGVILAGAAREYLRRFAVSAGRRVLVATNNDSAYLAALDLHEAGVQVAGIADTRPEVPAALAREMRSLSIPVHTRTIPVDTSGFSALSAVSVGQLSHDLQRVDAVKKIPCDALAVSGGWTPALHLYSQAGGKLSYNDRSRSLQPCAGHPSVRLVGSAAGIDVLDVAVRHARSVGETAAVDVLQQRASHSAAPESQAGSVQQVGIRVSPAGNTRRQWVDLRHDVTVADLELALREGYTSIEHIKRYTTVGMSVDQGKTSHVAAIEIVARLRGKRASELGHTTFRPPFTPVTLGAIAGRELGERFAPSRQLPMHDWHVANGALLQEFSEWHRPVGYLQQGESRKDAVLREARCVRTAAGLFDGSPLGKIEVQGPDAREFLDRFYINNLATLQPGRARYGLMLRESGVIFDDGTVVMLGPDHFLITTTSGQAGRVGAWLEEWHQCEWPQLRVAITSVTDQWATLSLTGPRAREILSQLDSDIDLSAGAFPHLSMREGTLLGNPARVYRVSFSGELTYEINVPARLGLDLWHELMKAGAPRGLQPFGLDALLLMRLEKGFLHIGTDTDGTTVPDDVGWGKAAAGKQADFIGKRSLTLPENVRPDRLQLIGLRSVDGADIPIGSHLRLTGSMQSTDGWVTSVGRAVLTGEPIALAMLRAGRQQVGAEVSVHDAGAVTRACVVTPPFFDPSGERMNA